MWVCLLKSHLHFMVPWNLNNRQCWVWVVFPLHRIPKLMIRPLSIWAFNTVPSTCREKIGHYRINIKKKKRVLVQNGNNFKFIGKFSCVCFWGDHYVFSNATKYTTFPATRPNCFINYCFWGQNTERDTSNT